MTNRIAVPSVTRRRFNASLFTTCFISAIKARLTPKVKTIFPFLATIKLCKRLWLCALSANFLIYINMVSRPIYFCQHQVEL